MKAGVIGLLPHSPPAGRGGEGRVGARRFSLIQISQDRTTPTPALSQLGGFPFSFARVALFALLLCGCAETNDRSTTPEPAGFWTGPMGGPVPATITGGMVIDTAGLVVLMAEKDPVLVDVGPMPHKPDNIPMEAWVPPPHRTIPGSIWLPGVGAGELAPRLDAWFRAWLLSLTGGDRSKPLVIFCHPNCWGSWNAAKRAIVYGYTAVHWYEEGIEGWQDAGQPTMLVHPELPSG